MSRSLFVTLLLLVVVRASASAQAAFGDVELLGQVHGTRPPASFFELKARQSDAFQFRNGWTRRAEAFQRSIGVGVPAAGSDAPAAALGPRGAAVQGTFHFPLVLGLFSSSPAELPFSVERIQDEFFDGPNTYYKTIPEFYREISGGRVDLVGHTYSWVRTALSQSDVTAGQSALPGRVGGFILEILSAVDDGSVDWGLFDNDGPDGRPNSGDDDGYVDFLAVMHPTSGAECNGSLDLVWSHKWNLLSATGQTYRTRSPSARGGMIHIDDYTIQPVQACPRSDGYTGINQIGVFAHELGHAFGLPDLYCTGTNCGHAGTGRWGLMGSGAWGCLPPPAHRPDRPCHMEAWSKAMLGWADVEILSPDRDHGMLTLPAVETTGKVYRVDAGDGSGDYFLLENRQRAGFDGELPESGLLVWRIDPQQLAARWGHNTVNNDRARMSVFLLQADGRNDLGTTGSNRGDGGDPFPGTSGRTVLHTSSTPSTLSHRATASGLTILDIAQSGQSMTFRLLTRFQNVVVRSVGNQGSGGLLTVDGRPVQGTQTSVRAAPFQRLSIEAAPGAPIETGVRWGFAGWLDDNSLARARTFVTPLTDAELVADYGQRREVQVKLAVRGEQFGVAPGTVTSSPASPDSWFPEGTLITFTATPTTGFGFQGWTGPLAGQANPAQYQVNAPVDAGVDFELTYRVQTRASHAFEAATSQELVLTAENGSAPVTWKLQDGRLPAGLTLSPAGVVTGAALETGQFSVTVEARDASGLMATGSLTLDVSRPRVGVDALVGLFLLGTPAPTEPQRAYLDHSGNKNGFYDLGDLRLFLLANPGLPATAAQRALVRTLLPTITFGPGEPVRRDR